MKFKFPYTLENGQGEKLVFHDLVNEPDGDRLVGESFVMPGRGPLMHTHWLQDEEFTVIKGKLAWQIKGQPVQVATEGETVLFKKGVPHRFYNAGTDVLHCKGSVKPANSFLFFISSIFAAQRKSGKPQPALFDAAYLLTKYASEYD